MDCCPLVGWTHDGGGASLAGALLAALAAAVGRSAERRRTRSPRPGATLGSRGLLEKSGIVSPGRGGTFIAPDVSPGKTARAILSSSPQTHPEYLLWVAEDGSTYWANTNTDGTHHGDAVTRSALYAMQYDDADLWDEDPDEDYRWDGLACGAFDARVARWGLAQARSPAIDAGSDDAWGYDSTSTNPKVIDMNQPDIGYKYYRRVADDDPVAGQEVIISFKQPTLTADSPEINGYQLRHEDGSGLAFYASTLPNIQGKDVVIQDIGGLLTVEGSYLPRVHTSIQKANGANVESQDGAKFRLIVDRTAP